MVYFAFPCDLCGRKQRAKGRRELDFGTLVACVTQPLALSSLRLIYIGKLVGGKRGLFILKSWRPFAACCRHCPFLCVRKFLQEVRLMISLVLKFSFARDLVGDSNVTSWRQISRLQAANYSRLKVTPRCHSYLVKSVNSIMTVRWKSNCDLPNKLIKWKTHSSSWNTTIVNCRREGYWIFIFPHDCSVLLPCLSFALQYK